MSSDGIRLLEILEGHLCSKSRVCVHFNPTTLVPVYGSQVRAEILNAWLQDPYIRNGFDTQQFGGTDDPKTQILWEDMLWQSKYTITGADGTLSIDGSQSPRYGGLNIIPQPSGLHKQVNGFAFGPAYLQLNPYCLRNCTFCNGDSGLIVEGRVDAAFATIDTFTVLLQELDDEDLSDCMKAVMASQPLSVLFEAQIDSQLLLAKLMLKPFTFLKSTRHQSHMSLGPGLQLLRSCLACMGGKLGSAVNKALMISLIFSSSIQQCIPIESCADSASPCC